MGDFFDSPGLGSESTIDDYQHDLFKPLFDFASNGLKQGGSQFDQLMKQLMESNSSKATGMAKDVWKQGFLDPVLNSFDSSIAPRINSQFAGIGGTLSSRRTKDLGDTLGNLTSQASGQFAQLLPQIEAFPLQETLGQIQGLGALQTAKYTPYQNALQFALTPTRSVGQTPAGPGWGLTNSAIQAIGFAQGAKK